MRWVPGCGTALAGPPTAATRGGQSSTCYPPASRSSSDNGTEAQRSRSLRAVVTYLVHGRDRTQPRPDTLSSSRSFHCTGPPAMSRPCPEPLLPHRSPCHLPVRQDTSPTLPSCAQGTGLPFPVQPGGVNVTPSLFAAEGLQQIQTEACLPPGPLCTDPAPCRPGSPPARAASGQC